MGAPVVATALSVIIVIAIATMVSLSIAYRRPRRGLEVTQTDVGGFRFDMLIDRQPVLVAEPVAQLGDVIRAWFRWNIVGSETTPPESLKNAAKFLVVHHVGAIDAVKPAVEVTNPAHTDAVLRVLMPPRSVLIVPHLWNVQPSPPEAFSVTPVDDVVTWLQRKLM